MNTVIKKLLKKYGWSFIIKLAIDVLQDILINIEQKEQRQNNFINNQRHM